eukprot:CAMPEP_0201922986 /NCGR_PEP_ID=MMETSP0903-20130614/10864_1 /ASSEMBLY_ACC=CAM_ASM_000552 /TAXON_ID=420261 /ORGANISM="Thalassiosira antarctica, Strain CCMP982" /LENGTH=833 /DNA_ID=CAMNT_0048460219 /DNA_START=124 /DNA_END=2622 /DNA_ORIENTATION=-
MMMPLRLFRVWLALAVSSQSLSCTEALSVHRFHGTHQHANRASNAAFVGGNHRLNSKLSMSTSAQTSSWSEMTVSQLKTQLKSNDLPVSGVKAVLIQRLEEHQATTTATTTAETPDNEPKQEEQNNDQPNRKKKFPPPKDETEVQVMEKEVQETVRMLEGLKLGGGSGSSQKSGMESSSSSSTPSRQLSKQKQQEKKMMQSLKQSLKQSQQNNAPSKANNVEEASSDTQSSLSSAEQESVEQLRLRPANDLKVELNSLRLSSKGRKPDLVNRLAEYYAARARGAAGYSDEDDDDDDDDEDDTTDFDLPTFTEPSTPPLNLEEPLSFAGIPRLSTNAANALHQAFGEEITSDQPASLKPTPIQSIAIPKLFNPPNPSALLHAPTGSGKSIAFLLPITETLWKEVEDGINNGMDVNDMENGIALILLPTRELAAQVAGVAKVLAPPGMVHLIPRPMDLMSCWKDVVDRGEEFEYFENEGDDTNGEGSTTKGRTYHPRILVGSAKSISQSLFGDKKMPGTPTNKPQGKQLLSSTRWLVMDEVDRLLQVKKYRTDKKSRRHEKPAAMLAAAVSRLTMGRVQVIAASATVGRPLRRELSRVLGLHSSECPETLQGEGDAASFEKMMNDDDETHVGRAVKIPDNIRNYVLPVDGSTSGSLLTSAAFNAKTLLQNTDDFEASGRKVLLVLTRNCDIKVHNAMGALRHFGISPEPQSLLDVLEADGTDRLVEAHRKVSGVEGVGGKKEQRNGGKSKKEEGYLLVTHEDNIRGLHLDGLDAVIVVGRPGSPDEYTHIAGRTGRAGRRGSVLNIVSYDQAAALASWTKMLGVDFLPVDESEVA